MLQHQFRQDKENTTAVGSQKSFATQTYAAAKPTSSKSQIGLKRRALGDINNQQNVSLVNKDSKSILSEKPGRANISLKQKSDKVLQKSNTENKKSADEPEIAIKSAVAVDNQWMSIMEREIADVRDEEEDACEDVISMDMRPSTYTKELLACRSSSLNAVYRSPPRLFLPSLLSVDEINEPQRVEDCDLTEMYAELLSD